MRRAVLLKTYQIKGSRFHLYSVVEPSINKTIVGQELYRPDEPVVVSLEVKNNDPRKSKVVEVGWLLRPHSEKAPVITVKEHIQLGALEEKTVILSKVLPPGTYDLMLAVFSLHQDVYEAEDLSTLVGKNLPDTQASKGQARYAGPKTSSSQGFLVYGPYRTYPAGKFETDFKIKYSNDESTLVYQGERKNRKEVPIAVIDISTEAGKTILARRVIREQDFEKINTYQTFQLSYFLKSPQSLEFRVFTNGQVDLWADTITTSFITGEWYGTPITVQEY